MVLLWQKLCKAWKRPAASSTRCYWTSCCLAASNSDLKLSSIFYLQFHTIYTFSTTDNTKALVLMVTAYLTEDRHCC